MKALFFLCAVGILCADCVVVFLKIGVNPLVCVDNVSWKSGKWQISTINTKQWKPLAPLAFKFSAFFSFSQYTLDKFI